MFFGVWQAPQCASALDQIAAAIPFRALLLVRLQNAGLEEQPVPAAHHDAIVERPAQFRRRRRVADRRQRRQIGADGENVLAGQFCEIRIGKGRVIARAVGRHAEAQRAVEIVVAPRRRCRCRGPASDSANRCAPNGVSMRLPPANGFAGSAVWQLAQSPAIGQRLAARDILGGGSALAGGLRRADERSCTKATERESSALSDVVPAPIDLFGRYSAKADGGGTSCHFAPGLPDDTNRKGTPLFPARNCDL